MTVEAALLVPVVLALVALLAQPGFEAFLFGLERDLFRAQLRAFAHGFIVLRRAGGELCVLRVAFRAKVADFVLVEEPAEDTADKKEENGNNSNSH